MSIQNKLSEILLCGSINLQHSATATASLVRATEKNRFIKLLEKELEFRGDLESDSRNINYVRRKCMQNMRNYNIQCNRQCKSNEVARPDEGARSSADRADTTPHQQTLPFPTQLPCLTRIGHATRGSGVKSGVKSNQNQISKKFLPNHPPAFNRDANSTDTACTINTNGNDSKAVTKVRKEGCANSHPGRDYDGNRQHHSTGLGGLGQPRVDTRPINFNTHAGRRNSGVREVSANNIGAG
jgi:hypothetical protein